MAPFPTHITATGWIRHNIPHLALQNIPHHTKFHITLCDLVVFNWKCGVMWDVWCAVPEMWFDVKIVELWWWDEECITHRTSSHHSTFYIASFHIKHHLWHYSKPHHIPRQTIPHHLTHFISHQHLYSILQYYISNCTVSATLCITPHVALHPISRYIPHKATFHVLHGTFQITSYI